jgi:hypothetical protein
MKFGYNSSVCYHRLSWMSLAKTNWSMGIAAGRVVVLTLVVSAVSLAQQATAVHGNTGELVRKAVENEISASNGPMRFMFRGIKTTPRGSTTKIYVETKEATAGVIVAYDGKPLTAAQRADERKRNERFVKNPEELHKKRAQEHEDTERTMRIVRALPDAFLYEEEGEEAGSEEVGRVGDQLMKLRFRPNPNYRPPTHVEEVLTGMQGHLLVDAVHYRIASIDGMLFREVAFGWGILGHLDKGGHFVVHQADVGDNTWEISSMSLKFTGKILLVKSLSIDSTEVYSDFKAVPPDLTFAQALELIRKQIPDAAENPLVSRTTQQ